MITFVLVVLALFLIPGPAVMLTLARSISGGRRIGIYTGIGIAVGDLIHTLAFEVVKYLGAAYLFYLGVRAFLEKSAGIHMPSVQRIDSHRAFRQAVLTEVLNPKTALFFLSFLPQFVQPEDGQVIIQLLVLGLTFVTLSIFYTTLLAFTAGSLGQWLSQHQGIARWQGKIMGFIYSGLGVQIALQHQD